VLSYLKNVLGANEYPVLDKKNGSFLVTYWGSVEKKFVILTAWPAIMRIVPVSFTIVADIVTL
jgi:hypothetical protein